ncbi:hypothetical protein CEB3_c20560 [Peptococcaceae bacterium CEB3]|nr:hypothetical protein CEB3_c20560 [Peptococcaceae bacterium CEB3]
MSTLKNGALGKAAVLTVLIMFLALGSFNDTLSKVVISSNFDPAKQYLDSHDFRNISLKQLFREVFLYSSAGKSQQMKLKDFEIGLNNAYKVRVMSMKVIDLSAPEPNSYLMQYNRDTNYFNVLKTEDKNGSSNGDPSATKVLTSFDKYKNEIIFPTGNYSYYTVKYLWGFGSLAAKKKVYLINDSGVHWLRGKTVSGAGFMVYGEPIGKEDSPRFYVMEI